ncbi:hypothetical protein [Stagnihabitans tardus]|uniref:Uncharacterized protein n=1 Tax=Stagnihabitans tardus TaxID=2699202 RepID=A0AAE5BUR0_9RHOB|nr:hypothetical protein [Stagnihabitans tardus]NBZ87049.1 hypothetical protein [Stagnihabitans tardus]
MRVISALVVALGLGVSQARAGLVWQGTQLWFLVAGAYCVKEPDSYAPAPSVKSGWVGVDDQPYDFFTYGAVSAATDVGIGVQARLTDARPGEGMTFEITGPKDGVPDSWSRPLSADGNFWFGRKPEKGEALDPGPYRFKVFRSGRLVLDYEVMVLAKRGPNPCEKPVS